MDELRINPEPNGSNRRAIPGGFLTYKIDGDGNVYNIAYQISGIEVVLTAVSVGTIPPWQ